MKTIAFDLMGGDLGVRPGIEATIEFLKNNLDYRFILVGDSAEISKYIKEDERIRIIHCDNAVSSEQKFMTSRKENTSMKVAIELVRDKKADAILSPGNSAVYLMQLILILKRLDGIKRPAFMPILPTLIKDKKVLLLDVGANLVATEQMLEQWAIIGNIFSNVIFKVKKPKVSILNIGTEKQKGLEPQQIVNEKLSHNKKMNYVGFCEPRDMLSGDFDVIVTDGYAGNIALKATEGSVLNLLKLIKNTINEKKRYKLGALLSKGAFKKVKERFDYRNVGAAWVIGLNALAMKAHGNSNKQAYLGSLNQIKLGLEDNILGKIKKNI